MIDASTVERTYQGGLDLMDRGLAPFLLARDDLHGKIPLHNCTGCTLGMCIGPTCGHLTCHGFYSATFEPDRWKRMVETAPGGFLAIATGISRVIAVDLEKAALADPGGLRERLDAAGIGELPTTLTAATPNGGLHWIFRISDDLPVISRNRVLPHVDIKAQGGYIAAPGGRRIERVWMSESAEIADAPAELLAWLRRGVTPKGRDAAGLPATAPAGYNYGQFSVTGPIGGCREFFFNDMAYRLRRNGMDYEGAITLARPLWEKCKNTPESRWFMPWRDVQYKFDRVWATVEPDAIDTEQRDLAIKLAARSSQPRQVGRVWLAGGVRTS